MLAVLRELKEEYDAISVKAEFDAAGFSLFFSPSSSSHLFKDFFSSSVTYLSPTFFEELSKSVIVSVIKMFGTKTNVRGIARSGKQIPQIKMRFGKLSQLQLPEVKSVLMPA